ncbi:MAG: ATP-binding cassette domain-containing protein [Patescibacteria group bacterium]|nr:ATP-binding cassette domain-containing protein [Patescibacteria group bacterium]
MIKVENLTKTYADFKALDGVSFEVQKGEIIGFLGPNGAGKTTTMRILTGFFPPTSGKVEIDGFDVFNDPVEVRKRIGYLPENTPLYQDMEVYSFLRYIAELKDVEPEKKNQHIKNIMERCGISHMKNEIISRLSKGYKQRVGLAQALIGDPKVLILDEPTIGLDPKQIIEIRNLIKELGKEKTIILSTHILPEVAVTCSRVIIINEGKIVAEDTPDNLENKVSGVAKVIVTVRGGSPDLIKTRLQGINGVSNVTVIKNHAGLTDLSIQSEKDVDVRDKVSSIIVQNNWGLIEMHRETLGLEEIFLKLTKKEK